MDLDNVHKPFIWRKKYEEKGLRIDEKQIELEARKKAEENKKELEKIRERQRLRELEQQQRLNDSEFLQRQKEAEQHEHWEQQEDDFILKQHKRRSKIRIRDGRAKPIDLFVHYIDIFGAKPETEKNNRLGDEAIDLKESPVELMNPCDWFNGLRASDLEALESDIRIYMNADFEDNHGYWKDLLHITLNEAAKLRSLESKSKGCASSSSAIMNDVNSLFEGKSIGELDDMEDEMSEVLRSDDPSVDVGFFKGALLRLRAHRARMRLTAKHKRNLERQGSKLLGNDKSNSTNKTSHASKIETVSVKASTSDRPDVDKVGKAGKSDEEDQAVEEDEVEEEQEQDDEEEDDDDDDVEIVESGQNSSDKMASEKDLKFNANQEKCIEDYKKGNFSPKMLRKSQLDPSVVCIDPASELESLRRARYQIANASTLDDAKRVTMDRDERAFLEAANKGFNSQEESTFSCEAAVRGLDNRAPTYAWADKYQPRKPRYFNRVHTGFEWNKYNQTHYDVDNPPPKVVQGYKFNIFYPDLIDKSKAPTFSLTPCKDDKDFCIIRFSAGPPYEDIAFTIVNRDWNNSHRSGYRCQFINNMLQLWFQFKRYRYRR